MKRVGRVYRDRLRVHWLVVLRTFSCFNGIMGICYNFFIYSIFLGCFFLIFIIIVSLGDLGGISLSGGIFYK